MNVDSLVSPIPRSVLENDGSERTQAFVDLFGELVFSLRDKSVEITKSLIESEAIREKAGVIPARPFDEIAKGVPKDQWDNVLKVSSETVDAFVRMLVSYIDHTGTQLGIDETHVAHFKLILQVVERGSERCVEEIALNRNKEVKFFKSWGRWLRRYHSAKSQK